MWQNNSGFTFDPCSFNKALDKWRFRQLFLRFSSTFFSRGIFDHSLVLVYASGAVSAAAELGQYRLHVRLVSTLAAN